MDLHICIGANLNTAVKNLQCAEHMALFPLPCRVMDMNIYHINITYTGHIFEQQRILNNTEGNGTFCLRKKLPNMHKLVAEPVPPLSHMQIHRQSLM